MGQGIYKPDQGTGQTPGDRDPCFVDPADHDYHLTSQGGRYDPNSQSWIQDNVTSPCIDAGDPLTAIGYEPYANGHRINMGAFGGTQQASLSIYDVNTFKPACVPNPDDGAISVILDIMPGWVSDPNVIMHDIYFGTSELPPFIRQQRQRQFYPGVLEPDTRYYWRIDEIDDQGIITTGNLWLFTTGSQPVQAYNLNPPDVALGVSPDVILSWSSGEDAVAHDVYFGFTHPPKFVCNQIETDIDPGQLYPQGMLPIQAQCYWRIDEIDSQGNITTGETWRFNVTEYKGRLCFTGQTPVWINDSFTPISKADIGQSIDGINRIQEVQEHEGTYTLYDILLESGNSITVAENHIFMTEAGSWLSLHKLIAGTRLKTLKGSIGIQSVTKQPTPFTGKVYNLKIQGSDRYMVGKDMVIVRDY